MLVTLLVATASQLVFDRVAFPLPFASELVQQTPWLARLPIWRAQNLTDVAVWAALTAGLVFGLAAPGWPAWQRTSRNIPAANGDAGVLPPWLAAAAVGMAAAVAFVLAAGAPEAAWMHWVWLGSAVVLLTAAAWATIPGHASRPRTTLSGQGWMLLLVALLLFTALMVGWGGTALPEAVDRTTARNGLAAATLLTDPAASYFAASRVGMPGLAHAPLALLIWITQDALLAVHLLAGVAALLLVGGVWLLASELFRRPDESPGALALVAAGLTAVSVPLLHFGRTAPGLLGVSAAVVAGWLLLRGVRRDNALAFVASGMLAGMAALLDRSSLVTPLLFGIWWLGIAVLRSSYLAQARWGQIWWWLAGLLVVTTPVLGVWMHDPVTFAAYARGLHLTVDSPLALPMIDAWANLRNNFLGLVLLPDRGPASVPDHFVHSLAAPFVWLGIGALLVNLDRFVGWALASWLIIPLLFASGAAIVAPDWSPLALLLPGISLTLAFVLDRFFAAWRTPATDWRTAPAAYLLTGLLVAIGFNSAVAYYSFAAANGDTASHVGRTARTVTPKAAVLVVSPGLDLAGEANEVERFLALPNAPPLSFAVDAMPPALPPGSHLLLMPGDHAALDAMRTRYPGGEMTVERDLHANPRLIVYRIP